MKRIPSSFTLGGHEFKVVLLSQEEMEDKAEGDDVFGMFVPQELTIYLERPSRKLKSSIVMQTFWHEYFHALFWAAGELKLTGNEKLVDKCGLLTHQMIGSAKFERSPGTSG